MASLEPDELYTLRAQYWLGHYQMAIDEARSVARRPMSPALKAEREEFLARAYIALGQYNKVTSQDTPALTALSLKAKYDEASGNESVQTTVLDELKTLVGSSSDPSIQLTAAHVLLSHEGGQTKEALQCVHLGSTMEHIATMLQIYLKIDRLDLAQKQLSLLKQADEEAILTQLCSVQVNLATGSTAADDAIHTLNSLQEQYGPSVLLLNLAATALMQQGEFGAAEAKLQEALTDHSAQYMIPDTLINLICCCAQQKKSTADYLVQMQQLFPLHPFCAGLERVTAAFDREAVKYQVAS